MSAYGMIAPNFLSPPFHNRYIMIIRWLMIIYSIRRSYNRYKYLRFFEEKCTSTKKYFTFIIFNKTLDNTYLLHSVQRAPCSKTEWHFRIWRLERFLISNHNSDIKDIPGLNFRRSHYGTENNVELNTLYAGCLTVKLIIIVIS